VYVQYGRGPLVPPHPEAIAKLDELRAACVHAFILKIALYVVWPESKIKARHIRGVVVVVCDVCDVLALCSCCSVLST
jgi:hypothetical protein